MDDSLAGDLVALWQSELTAMAADRELREGWTALVALWAAAVMALAPRHDAAPGSADAAQPPGAAAVAAASEPGLAAVGRLNRRVTELEQRLAELEQRGGA